MRILALLPILFFTGCSVFSGSYPSVIEDSQYSALDTAVSDETGWLVFKPDAQLSDALVFYPGGKVEPTAYSLLANELAEELGLMVVVVPMPLDLAVLGGGRGTKVQEYFPSISQWYIGGHSLGGTMAASLAYKNPEDWLGLILLASYPQDKHDFSNSDQAILTAIGDRDGLISIERWQASLALLPTQASTLVILGGNHAGFGTYGEQEGDLPATISQEAQRRQTIDAIGQLLVGD